MRNQCLYFSGLISGLSHPLLQKRLKSAVTYVTYTLLPPLRKFSEAEGPNYF